MTELREPPWLSEENTPSVYEVQRSWTGLSWETCERLQSYICEICERKVQAQREADIKWMKEHCYLKAERELPEIISIPSPCNDAFRLGAKIQADKMLKEVDGVSFKAVKGWD